MKLWGIKLWNKILRILSCYCHQDRSNEQNREARNKPTHYGQLILTKVQNAVQEKKDSLLNKLCWNSCASTVQKYELGYILKPCTKINSRWVTYLNVNIYRTWKHRRKKSLWPWVRKIFLRCRNKGIIH